MGRCSVPRLSAIFGGSLSLQRLRFKGAKVRVGVAFWQARGHVADSEPANATRGSVRYMSNVIVLDYDERWPVVFEQLRSAVWPAVSDIAESIEHVGSTSVPGLAAKPVIDMDVVVGEPDLTAAIARLSALGYGHRGDLGIRGREAFRNPSGTPKHHLYLCSSNSPALANHLAVRDHLRAHPTVVNAYGALKKRLASEFPQDIDGYVEGKTHFLLGILRDVGFPADLLSEIERANVRP